MMSAMRKLRAVLVVIVASMAFGACLNLPGDTSKITLVSSTTTGGWQYDYYRNTAYPCSISGYQTFVVGTKVGSAATDPRPLWAFLHGGGAGYFDENGHPIPGTGQKTEESAASLQTYLTNNGLLGRVRADAAGFRTLAVSYCSHDIYAGTNTPDPHNPNTTPDGKPRPTTGDLATKAAIQFVQSHYSTTKTFLHGTSAGSAGAFNVAWSMQLQGIAPAGVVADASIVNVEAFQAGFAAGYCTDSNDPGRVSAIAARVDPDIANVDNEPDKLVSSGRLTVPLFHIWNHGDQNTCGSPPVDCPLRDGSHVTLGLTDCIHEPMRLAIAAEGPTSKSVNFPVCVDNDSTPDCSVHVITTKPNLVNTDPSTPSDYFTAIMNWVHARLADT
jgi:hypothetical protein